MHFRRIVSSALLVAAWSPLVSAAKDGTADPPTAPQPGTPASLSQPPTRTSPTTASSKTTTSNAPNLIGALWRASREFGMLGCVPQLLPLVTSLPTPIPAELLGADMMRQALAQTTLALDQVCEYAVTGAAGAAFTAFLPRWYGWYDAHAEQVRRLVDKCPKAAALTRTADAYRACGHVVDIVGSATAAATQSAEPERVGQDRNEKIEL
ncbi:hypothetical protein PG999_003962 [Apiospora kogelbergensis]|uniref:Uncharacterized protein n=1 Tax=Apiospora kogelbergensis TaxID=1337665 RepID=A0AAW0R594_9PEZI